MVQVTIQLHYLSYRIEHYEREEFLSQAQETSCGNVVYTGMNDKGDFYIETPKHHLRVDNKQHLIFLFQQLQVKIQIV